MLKWHHWAGLLFGVITTTSALYYKRPLWDIVVIGLSIGGLALSATTLLPAWRRLRRHLRGFARTGSSERRMSEAVKG